MTEQQLSIDFDAPTGRQLRDDGIARAVDHADDTVPEWSGRALAYVREYARTHATLTSEQVRHYAEACGFPRPPDGRAWGGPMVRAANEGTISRTDRYVPAQQASNHMKPMMVWRSQKFGT